MGTRIYNGGIRQVPAMVCSTCGEKYLIEEIIYAIFSITEHDMGAHVQVDIND
ncbi:MAG: YgiT-type zinc finger protein [Methanomicrobiales archaeon]|nr:YgiT-type zinc finger protein [Methanomicrobiales archaeon]